MKAFIKQIMFLFMWYPLRAVIRFLPPRIIYFLGIIGGDLLYLLSRDKRAIMADEWSRILPDTYKHRIGNIVKGSFENYCTSELEVLLYPAMNKAFIEKIVTISGKEYLDNALSKGRGVLLFQAHFGAFQMVMPVIGYSGYRMNQISASASVWKEEASASWIQKRCFDMKADYERKLPVQHISVKSSLRPVFRALERNEIVGITVDGGEGKKPAQTDFLGRRAYLQRGGVELAVRTGAAIVPAFIITDAGLRHRLIIHPPLIICRTPDKEENISNALKSFAAILEDYVLRYPTHYGYTLYLRKARALLDDYPLFADCEAQTR